jgi:putative ABC transport system ATP-binding protein
MADDHDLHSTAFHGSHHTTPRPWSRIRELLAPERADLAVILIYSCFVALLGLATPIAVEAMVSTVMFGVVIWPIVWLALILLVCLTLAGIIGAAEAYVIEFLQRRIFVRTVADVSNRLPRVKLEAYEEEYGPSIVNRFFDVLNVMKSLATLLLDGVNFILAAFVGMIVLAFYHPYLLAFDICLIASFLGIILLGRGGVRTSINESHFKYEIAAWLQQLARSPRAFKTGTGPDLAVRHADHLAQQYLDNRRIHFSVVWRQYLSAIALQIIVNVLLLVLGGWLVMKRELTAGQLIAAELIVSLVLASMLKLNKYLESWYDLCTGVEKLALISELPIERGTGEVLNAAASGMRVSVNELGYDTGRSILGGLSWKVDANEKVGFTGRAGSGKSVLLDVLAGLREPTSGHLELDGVDLRDLQLESVRRQVAVVHGIEIFAGSIAENLKLGCDRIGAAESREALMTVGLLETVYEFPAGLETPLTPTGSPLSRSQSLRLCIARAIVDRPRLLILDGVLDLIDQSECPNLHDVLFAPDAPWTLLIVSHRPEILARCDRVIGVETELSAS